MVYKLSMTMVDLLRVNTTHLFQEKGHYQACDFEISFE